MKNYEKYADEIREFEGISFCDQFVIPYILKSVDCSRTSKHIPSVEEVPGGADI